MTEVKEAPKTSNATPKCMWILERGALRSKAKTLAVQGFLNLRMIDNDKLCAIFLKNNTPKPENCFCRFGGSLTLKSYSAFFFFFF